MPLSSLTQKEAESIKLKPYPIFFYVPCVAKNP